MTTFPSSSWDWARRKNVEIDKNWIIDFLRKFPNIIQIEHNNYYYSSRIHACPMNLERIRAVAYKGAMHQSFDCTQRSFPPFDSRRIGLSNFLAPYK